MFISRDQHAGQNHNIKVSNKSFEKFEIVQIFGGKQIKMTFMKKLLPENMQPL